MTYRSVIPSGRNRDELPTLKDLNKHIVVQYAAKYKSLGLELGLEKSLIDIISYDYPNNVVARFNRMLQAWLERDITASWGKLDDAIKIIEQPSTSTPVSHDDTVYNKPSMKTLQSHDIIAAVGPHWFELGMELLDDKEFMQLHMMESNYNDVNKCCVQLFHYWLKSHPEATWQDLVKSLRSPGVGLNSVAAKVERIISGPIPLEKEENIAELQMQSDKTITKIRDYPSTSTTKPHSKENEEVVSASSPLDTHNWTGDIETIFFDKNKGEFFSDKHGVTIIVPSGAIKSGIKAEMKFGATLLAPIKFPKNTIPVSAVIWLCMNAALEKSIEIQIPHFINIKTDAQAKKLQFAKAVHSSSGTNILEIIDGGKFIVGKSHGSIEVDHFCYYCVVYNFYDGSIPDYKYQAVLFQNKYLHSSIWKLHICIAPALPTCKVELKKQYDLKEWDHKNIVQEFSFDTALKKVDIEFDESQFRNEAQVVKINVCLIDKTHVDFHEAYKNHVVKKELKQKMKLKEYPPRFKYEIFDVTEKQDFFTRPRILGYKLKGGRVDTMDGDKEAQGKIVIPSLSASTCAPSSEGDSQIENMDKLWKKDELRNIGYGQKKISILSDKQLNILDQVLLLLLTVNDNEDYAAVCYLEPLPGHNEIFRYFQRDDAGVQTQHAIYLIGKYGACPAAVRQIEPGAEIGGATTAPNLAFRCFKNLNAIIGMGVACGVEKEVELCDVLVANKVNNYDQARLEQGGPLSRGFALPTSDALSSIFKQTIMWPDGAIKERLYKCNVNPKIKQGIILSGPYLIDNAKIKKELIQKFASEAIGIEMEAAYLFKGAQQVPTHMTIVKAVCDFGDGKKNKVFQPTAALLAADCVKQYLDEGAVKLLRRAPNQ